MTSPYHLARWAGNPDYLWDKEDGREFPIDSISTPQAWLGNDRHSTAARRHQAVPGRVPGSDLILLPGRYEKFRHSLTNDIDSDKVRKHRMRPNEQEWDRGYIYPTKNNDRIGPDEVTLGEDEMSWIRAATPGTVFFDRTYMEWGGAQGYDGITWDGAGVDLKSSSLYQFENPTEEWQRFFRNVEFHRCKFDGGYRARTNQGTRVKWGIFGYNVGASVNEGSWGFVLKDCDLRGIYGEHLIYMHGIAGITPHAKALLIDRCRFKHAGRTAFQDAARDHEGGGGQGHIVIQRSLIEDVCLQQSGGGSALTFKGNHEGHVVVRDTACYLGANQDLHAHRSDNITGAFVSHSSDRGGWRKTTGVHLDRCHFQTGPHFVGRGSARRPCVMLGGAHEASFTDMTVHQYHGARPAVEFDGREVEGIGKLKVTRRCDVRGDVMWLTSNGRTLRWKADPGHEDGELQGSEGWEAFVDEAEAGHVGGIEVEVVG